MKNIHILPTDKPSRLFYNVGGALLFTKWDNYNGVHIYITSDEEIKEGDWYISILENEVYKATKETQNIMSVANLVGTTTYKNTHFKIILTTDRELNKAGVWGIEDGFLEWFVKNPTCEYVELKGYAIILPGKSCDCDNKCDACKEEEPKQETLEEAIKIELENYFFSNISEIKQAEYFINFGAKWQAKRMYREEDMKEAFEDGKEDVDYCQVLGFVSKLTTEEWFEQIKTNRV